MGKIVSAAATSHTFGSAEANPEAVERIWAGMKALGESISASRPDIVIIASSDHLNNFNLDAQIPLAIGTSDEFVPLGDMGVPKTLYQGNRGFAQEFAQYCSDVDLDLVPVENIQPDHGVSFPNAFANPVGRAALVPLYINSVMTPTPSCRRAYSLGQALKRFVETARPAEERVAVLGSGGLSHWICLPESGQVNEEWDLEIIHLMTSGRGAELGKLSRAEILKNGGNGGLEIATWSLVAGAAEGCRGTKIYYEPMTPWWTGMGGVVMDIHN
ncbi:protocatechuate 3,4-dioxygenase [Pseudomonas asiatica]|uniref:DODA-type extradiol aromatic ring-opening family dioxygenase n=1 Tax=Pseudomonas asiatica TaxID=2219225 RepID=UPI0018AB0EBF|nr:protocatechuate 3,4-dioxygenase [Pseudomonas asiatica]MBF8803522.1 protocatechuate 3,4-dioxygenase [Pseudomonas asiatica]